MTRIRSPGYPSISLSEAIDLVRKVHEANRRNVTDREAAVKDMGYSGLTGHSAKMISDVSHYGLIERAGKGGLRVTDTAVRILHPRESQERNEALQEAAFSPELFAQIKEQWPDGFASEHALRNFLIRQNFSSNAVQPALKAYTETYAYLQQAHAIESHRQEASSEREPLSGRDEIAPGRQLVPVQDAPAPPGLLHYRPLDKAGVGLMDGERIVFVEEAEASQYLKLVASGEISTDMLEALEDFIKRQKRRLGRGIAPTQSDG